MDRLGGLLAEGDFERIYRKIVADRALLEERLKEREQETARQVSSEERADELVSDFMESAFAGREVLVSLIERVEMTENREIIINFRFRDPGAAV